ncbi:MAG: hypothetical protein ABWK01_03120 [Infirmifilum sp.]
MSAGGVCPGLYRDSKGKFYCKYAGGVEVDPAFMPCLMEYWECPYYLEWKKKASVEKKPAEETVTTPRQPPEVAQQPRIERPSVVISEEKPPVEKVADELDMLASKATELSKLWEEYDRAAREIIERWEEIRDYLEKEVISIESTLNTLADELERIEVRHKIGVLDDSQYQDLKSELERRIAEKTSEMESIKKRLDEVDRLVLPHYKRVKVAEVKPEIAKIRLALNKLEEKFREGGLTEETYKRLKEELEAKLKRLERIREEVEE